MLGQIVILNVILFILLSWLRVLLESSSTMAPGSWSVDMVPWGTPAQDERHRHIVTTHENIGYSEITQNRSEKRARESREQEYTETR